MSTARGGVAVAALKVRKIKLRIYIKK